MSPVRIDLPRSGTPLSRYADWYDALSAELRAHLAPRIFLPRIDAVGTGSGSPRGPRVVSAPGCEAEVVAELVARTDAALADPIVREQWTGEGALAALGEPTHDAPRRAIGERALGRTVEWMRAIEQWSLLRGRGLAGRRIERWLAKHGAA